MGNKKEKIEKKEKKSTVIKEFKEFISRGSVMDLAVGMIIGAAFTAIVNSAVNDMVMPLIGIIIGGIDFSSLAITIPGLWQDQAVTINFGLFIQAVINFLVIAVCIFILIKFLNSLKTKLKKAEEEKKAEEPPKEPEKPDETVLLLTEIRDLLNKKDYS